MSLYRSPGRVPARTLVLAGVAALVAGLVAGFVLGRATAPEPTLAEQVTALRAALAPAASGLELTATEYGQAVRGGRVVAPTEYDATRSDLARVRATLTANHADLRAYDRAGAEALDAAVARVDEGVRGRIDPAQVRRRVDEASQTLREVTGR
jgi:hypothetical protein